jgi:hypothetical protein
MEAARVRRRGRPPAHLVVPAVEARVRQRPGGRRVMTHERVLGPVWPRICWLCIVDTCEVLHLFTLTHALCMLSLRSSLTDAAYTST